MTIQDLQPTTLFRKVGDAYQRQQTRRALQDLTPDQLRDIGITTEQALRESRQPFWRTSSSK